MKIAYILNEFPSVSETFILREILALQKRSVDITVYALKSSRSSTNPPDINVCYRPFFFSANVIRAKLFFLTHHPTRLFRVFFSVFRNLTSPLFMLKLIRNMPATLCFAHKAALRNTTHIHAHFAFIPADIARIIATLLDIPFSVSAHAWDIYTQNKTAIKKRLAGATFTAVCTNRGYIHLSNMLPEMHNKLHLVYHGLVPDEFTPAAPTDPQILAVGRLVEKKGFGILLKACAVLKSRGCTFTCMLVGDGPQRQRLESISADCELGGLVTFAGETIGKKLTNIFNQSAVLVMPSICTASEDVDGIPNVILEGMAVGIPVVSTDASSANEAVTDGKNGFIVPAGNPSALADKIEILLTNKSEAISMGKHGRQIVREKFNADTNIETLIKLF
ncbi:MAG: glycosyltransferase [Kiritimatiellae bacterium]|nr:glycosyltransferase [Kiritimatiellia bacterium]